MLICPSCGSQDLVLDMPCPSCKFIPEKIDGFSAWAPELAHLNDGFPSDAFQSLAQREAGNFWFRSRNALIIWALSKSFSNFESFLEVGCGTGFVLNGIAERFPSTRFVGTEIHTAGLKFASERVHSVKLSQMDARKLPFVEEFDVVGAFDVIEHIEEDELVLRNFFQAVKPGGGCLITVPQHKWLWSPIDEMACHQRRYSVSELHDKIARAGFRLIMSTSFVSLLLPAMLMSRVAGRLAGKSRATNELSVGGAVNVMMEHVMSTERQLIQLGVRFPFGGSRLVVAKKD